MNSVPSYGRQTKYLFEREYQVGVPVGEIIRDIPPKTHGEKKKNEGKKSETHGDEYMNIHTRYADSGGAFE